MRNLTRIAFVLSLAACDGGSNNPADLCETDPTAEECFCSSDQACADLGDEECLEGFCNGDGRCDVRNVCPTEEGDLAGEFVVFPQPNGNTFFGFVVDFSASMKEALDLAEAEDAAVPIDDCIEQEFTDIEGEPDPKPVGDVTISKGGAPVATLTFDATTGKYEDIAVGVVPGDTLDVEFPGEGVIGNHDLTGFAAMPAAFPAFKNVVNNSIDLSTGIITYDPLNGTYVRISTSFIEGQQGVSLLCGSNGSGTLTIPPAFLARMPMTGSINLSVTNRQFRPLGSSDGVLRRIRSVVRMSTNVGYTKP